MDSIAGSQTQVLSRPANEEAAEALMPVEAPITRGGQIVAVMFFIVASVIGIVAVAELALKVLR